MIDNIMFWVANLAIVGVVAMLILVVLWFLPDWIFIKWGDDE